MPSKVAHTESTITSLLDDLAKRETRGGLELFVPVRLRLALKSEVV